MNKKTTKKTSTTKKPAARARNKAFSVVMYKLTQQRVELYIEAPSAQVAREIAYFNEPKSPAIPFRRVVTLECDPEPQDPENIVIDEVLETEPIETLVDVCEVDTPQYIWYCPFCENVNDIKPAKHDPGDELKCSNCHQSVTFSGRV